MINDALASYTNYYEGTGVSISKSTTVTMPTLGSGNANQSRALTYAVVLTPETGVTNAVVYGKMVIDPASYTYGTKVQSSGDMEIIDSGTITVAATVMINGTTLTADPTTITISGN